MKDKSEIVRVIISLSSSEEAEEIVSMIRNHGRATRSQIVTSRSNLVAQLEKDAWDLVIWDFESKALAPKELVCKVKETGRSIPIVFLCDQVSEIKRRDALSLGGADLVSRSNRELLALVVERALGVLRAYDLADDLTARLEDELQRCDALLEGSFEAIAYVAGGMHVYANNKYLSMFGYSDVQDLESVTVLDLVSPRDQGKFKKFFKSYELGERTQGELELSFLLSDENEQNLTVSYLSSKYDGEPCLQIMLRPRGDADAGLSEVSNNIAKKDTITNTYTRTFFLSELERCIGESQLDKKKFMFYYVKLNGYDKLELQIGPSGLDALLKQIARLLQTSISEDAALTHFSDDVFVFLVSETDLEVANALAHNIFKKISEFLPEHEGKTLRLSARIGMAELNETITNAEGIIRNAHAAANRILDENEEGAGFHMHTCAENIEDNGGDEEIVRLRKAIDQGLFKILFQPIISLRGSNQPFYEVVLRMLNETGEQVSPQAFLKTAIANKLTEKIDRWVVIQSIKALAREYNRGEATRIIINITAQTLLDGSFISWLRAALKASRLPHESLVFQLTASDANTYLKQAQVATKLLSELECKVSLSQFGRSSDSFDLIKQLSIDYVKLDGGFTTDLGEAENFSKLKEVVNLVHKHGKLMIASFVDEVKVLSSLYMIGMNYIQGYYLQPPGDAMDYDFETDDDD